MIKMVWAFLHRPVIVAKANVSTTTLQWRIQDFSEGDAAGVWPPIFSEGMTPCFYGRLLARIGVARISQRVGTPSGGSRISGWGTMEGLKAPNEARSAGAPRGVGSGEDPRLKTILVLSSVTRTPLVANFSRY